MAVYVRTKRVTDPLNDKVKACLSGRENHRHTSYNSSGSEHSPCLSDLVHGFLEDESSDVQNHNESSDFNRDSLLHETVDAINSLLNPSVDSNQFRICLLSLVSKAVDDFACVRSNMSIFRRKVMTYLRDAGYNAAICKTKWESSGGLTAGNYEFIDVVRSDSSEGEWQQRYIVDVDFSGEFVIARPTANYECLLHVLPNIYVGRPEELKQIVRLVAEAAKRSLKSRELSLPPWRKNRYMQTKWFGPYRRTVNQGPATVFFPNDLDHFSVKCRSIGFDTVSDDINRFVFPTAGDSNQINTEISFFGN
ncbi:uncharacterized protein LOC122659694 [Telopea speciosissima]|uniref:uncharacterized protein LOC122659694 n=1 Tax=Telopea speciosissima TaxID=54955 RepID=UPI001CC82F9E|nr:uncharacterized protein LOC122659694 [Telopea speciosissima]